MVLLLGCLLLSCADVAPIENGAVHGPLVTLQDFFTSCHLLETEAGVVLIDACWRKEELVARLAEHGVAPGDVTAVLFTHGHADHVKGLEALPNARVLALAAEQPVLETHSPVDATIDQVLSDGEVLRFGSLEVRVYAVPGHTPGSAAYLVDDVLALGDSGLVTASGAFAPVPEDRSEDPAELVRSVVALADRLESEGRSVRWIVPAHSGALEGRAALDTFVAKNRK
jgi:glyoxylase-like metal-dependent hydrolase (beta-lactamase superfamily II)